MFTNKREKNPNEFNFLIIKLKIITQITILF